MNVLPQNDSDLNKEKPNPSVVGINKLGNDIGMNGLNREGKMLFVWFADLFIPTLEEPVPKH